MRPAWLSERSFKKEYAKKWKTDYEKKSNIPYDLKFLRKNLSIIQLDFESLKEIYLTLNFLRTALIFDGLLKEYSRTGLLVLIAVDELTS